MTPAERAMVEAVAGKTLANFNEGQFIKALLCEPGRVLVPREAAYLRRIAAKCGVAVEEEGDSRGSDPSPGASAPSADAPTSPRPGEVGGGAAEALTMVEVARCRPSPSARPVLPIKVAELARSIAEIGLRQPISVRAIGDGYEVRGGGHRLAAFVALGLDLIPAIVRADSDLRAELAEIDENLVRNELGPAERAAAVARRKAIYEELHPETAHGSPGVSRQVGDTRERHADAERFTKSTADATGASERTIQRDAARGEAIGEDHLRRVAGTSLDKGEELDALAKLPEEKREAIIDRAAAGEKVSAKVEVKKDRRETREAELGEKQRALPQKRYGVILADPEWRFEPWSRETGMDRAADNHYPTSALEVITTRPVETIAAKDAVLFLWATVPMLPHALLVMAAWGFDYVTNFAWAKDRIGTGYWNRNRHEHLLVGTRGDIPAPAPGTQWDSVIEAPAGGHSEKPESVYDLIESHFPSLPKIELNARTLREGWDAWGLEAPGEDDANSDPLPTSPLPGEGCGEVAA